MLGATISGDGDDVMMMPTGSQAMRASPGDGAGGWAGAALAGRLGVGVDVAPGGRRATMQARGLVDQAMPGRRRAVGEAMR